MATKKNLTTTVSFSPKTIKNVKAIQSKSRTHEVTEIGPDAYSVKSGASGKSYNVHITAHGGSCSCDWGSFRPRGDTRSGCSHVTAVYNHIAAESGRKVSAWGSKEDAQRQHKPTLSIGDGVTLTARLQPAPILWIIQSQRQDQPQILEVI
jgi:hypothetical protein